MELFNDFIQERADDYVKGAAKEAGKKVRDTAKGVASGVKDTIEAGRDASFKRDFVDYVKQMVELMRQQDKIVVESLVESVVEAMDVELSSPNGDVEVETESKCPYFQTISRLWKPVQIEPAKITIVDEEGDKQQYVISYDDSGVQVTTDTGNPERAAEIQRTIETNVAEIINSRQVAEAITGLYLALEHGHYLEEKWLDFVKGAAGAVKDKLKPVWDKAKETYKEIDAAGREASKAADTRRESEKTAARKAAMQKKRDQFDPKISKVAKQAAKLIKRREAQMEKTIQSHPTLRSYLKDTDLSDYEKTEALKAINKARREVKD